MNSDGWTTTVAIICPDGDCVRLAICTETAMGCPVDVEEATTTSKASIAKCTIARECLSLNFSAQFVEIGIGPLGEYLILISNPKHQALGFWVCELLCHSAPLLLRGRRVYPTSGLL